MIQLTQNRKFHAHRISESSNYRLKVVQGQQKCPFPKNKDLWMPILKYPETDF